jgi:hypothetical protein
LLSQTKIARLFQSRFSIRMGKSSFFGRIPVSRSKITMSRNNGPHNRSNYLSASSFSNRLRLYLNEVEWGWYLWSGFCGSILRWDLSPEYRPGTGGTDSCNPAFSPEATARAHESIQHSHPSADGPNRMVIVAGHLLGWINQHLLRFERVDNSGAYSIPSDTCLLIPSLIEQ